MSIPAILYLVVNFFCMGVLLVKRGTPAKVSFFTPLLTWVFITLPLLYWGGFFS